MTMLANNALAVPPSPTTRTSPVAATPPGFGGNIDLVQQWDEATVGEWLKSVNCGKYRQLFERNNINGDALLDCDQNILKEVGVTKVGDRIRIMVAVKALRAHAHSISKVLPFKCPSDCKAARSESSATSPSLNGSFSPTVGYHYHRSGNNSATSSPLLSSTRATLEPPHSPGLHESSSHLRHQKSVPSIDGGGIMSLDHVKQVHSSSFM